MVLFIVRITVHVSGLAGCSTGPRQIEHFSSPLSDPIAEKIYFFHMLKYLEDDENLSVIFSLLFSYVKSQWISKMLLEYIKRKNLLKIKFSLK